jgi:hypothetical protein
VNKIREGVAQGRDTGACILNYKKDGTAFWNNFFVAALYDKNKEVVNYVGVQCEVPEQLLTGDRQDAFIAPSDSFTSIASAMAGHGNGIGSSQKQDDPGDGHQ